MPSVSQPRIITSSTILFFTDFMQKIHFSLMFRVYLSHASLECEQSEILLLLPPQAYKLLRADHDAKPYPYLNDNNQKVTVDNISGCVCLSG